MSCYSEVEINKALRAVEACLGVKVILAPTCDSSIALLSSDEVCFKFLVTALTLMLATPVNAVECLA